MDYLKINGSMGEGGGSILRLSAAFSVLFNQPIHIINIRANRSKPGLRLQHLVGLLALKELSGGSISSVNVGTMELKFTPGNGFKSEIDVQIRTAGSIALLAQTIQTASINASIKTESEQVLIHVNGGGTFGLGAPDPYYLNGVTYRYFKRMGYECNITVNKNGFYPKGGATTDLYFKPLKDPSKELKPLIIHKPGNLVKIAGNIVASDRLRKPKVAERIKKTIIAELMKSIMNNSTQYDICTQYVRTLNAGVGLSIWAEFDSGAVLSSGTVLGKRGVSSETIGEKAVKLLQRDMNSGATVGSHLADQIIPLLYICDRTSSITVPLLTPHMQTNIELLNLFGKREYQLEKIGSGNAYKFEYL
ncbi:MAG: RNA 3'-terminal phosphate cyclase [Promethearchaeota archaeon]